MVQGSQTSQFPLGQTYLTFPPLPVQLLQFSHCPFNLLANVRYRIIKCCKLADIREVIHSYLKACYFMKVGLVDLSTYGGEIKFEFLVMAGKFNFPAMCTQVHKADFLKIISL